MKKVALDSPDYEDREPAAKLYDSFVRTAETALKLHKMLNLVGQGIENINRNGPPPASLGTELVQMCQVAKKMLVMCQHRFFTVILEDFQDTLTEEELKDTQEIAKTLELLSKSPNSLTVDDIIQMLPEDLLKKILGNPFPQSS